MARLAGIIKALHTVKEYNRLIAEIRKVIMQVLGQAEDASFGDTPFCWILLDIHNIAFNQDQRLDSGKNTKFSMPFGDVVCHAISS